MHRKAHSWSVIVCMLGIVFKEIALIPYLNNVNDNVNVEL